MMIRVNDIYLDFNGDIEIERQVKLFEEISETHGDFSYSASMAKTSNNYTALGIPVADSITKLVYTQLPAVLFDDEGTEKHRGSLRVESIDDEGINFSFFSGNSNWMSLLVGDMTELRLSQYDRDLNPGEIVASWTDTGGIIFPLIDTGTLVTRGFRNTITEDFVGCFFVHTLVKEVFQQAGIKVEGELFNDAFFKTLVLASNARSINDVNNSRFFVSTDTTQSISNVSQTDVTFEDQTGIYSVGDDITVVGNKDFYVNTKMTVDVEIMVQSDVNFVTPRLTINGAFPIPFPFDTLESSIDTSDNIYKQTWHGVRLNSGDYVTVEAISQFGAPIDLIFGTVKFTPRFIYKAFGKSAVPLWTKQQFISNVLSIFCTVVAYDNITKTLTINLFDKIRDKLPIDISDYIKVDSVDFSEFISSYGENNKFSYEEGDDEDLGEYNISSFVKYGAGVIPCNNEFIPKSVDVIQSDFSAPISYFNPVINCSLEKINFVEIEEIESAEVTSVTDVGDARFNITDADLIFDDGDFVRIDVTADDYNGDFTVTAVTSTYIEVRGLSFTLNATGTITLISHKLTTDDSVYLFATTAQEDCNDLFDTTFMYITDTPCMVFRLAFFNILRVGRTFEAEYNQGLSFQQPNNPLSYQRTLLEKFWVQFSRILQDPVKLLTSSRYPMTVYQSIDFLRPLIVRTEQTSNLYFPNRITELSNGDSETELIKIS